MWCQYLANTLQAMGRRNQSKRDEWQYLCAKVMARKEAKGPGRCHLSVNFFTESLRQKGMSLSN